MIKLITAFIYYLPELLELIRVIEKHAAEYERKKDLKVKLKAVAVAYETGNTDLINSLFTDKLRE